MEPTEESLALKAIILSILRNRQRSYDEIAEDIVDAIFDFYTKGKWQMR